MRSNTPGAEEGRQLLRPLTPEDDLYEEAQLLCRMVSPWPRLLALAPCAPPPDVADEQPERAPCCRSLLTCLAMLAALLLILVSIALQWAHCQRVYLDRLMASSHLATNSSVAAQPPEYLCIPSFVWTFLVPRLLWALGYLAIFVCWFCLRQPDLAQVVSKAYESVTDQGQYKLVSRSFAAFCRRDRAIMVFWFCATNVISLFSSLLGEGILTYDLAQLKPFPAPPLATATYVCTCLVRLLLDNLMVYCIITYTLSLKYFHLMMTKTADHLMHLCIEESYPECFAYVQLQTAKICEVIHGTQPFISTALLLAMLRICQTATLMWLDLTNHPRRWQSLGQAPMAACLLLQVLYVIHRCLMTSAAGRAMRGRRAPTFAPTRLRSPMERTSPRRVPWDSRRTVLWHTAMQDTRSITGQLFGYSADQCMYWLVLVGGACYCLGYHSLEVYRPLI
ncbi:uncharacterized protein LOC119105264 [Pollicipes pollicipes]|uniref:uncharacterized protein LOC119105264 n=1 Tax=Pollicipes pollicipes TaxID=41117 RepID=UPI0018849939|nr:uncharacterized protein LOC119105264 [Pollicipes pollicipes]